MDDPKNKHVLIVEDDRSLIGFLSVTISHDGFSVSLATDGEGAVRSIQSSKPDLIVLDMMLPQKSGFEIIRLLQTPEHRNIPIIAVSGKLIDDGFHKMILLEPNVKEYIVKPLKPQYLLFKIHSLLGTTPPQQNLAEKKGRKFRNRISPESF